jgi:hypothetical protein
MRYDRRAARSSSPSISSPRMRSRLRSRFCSDLGSHHRNDADDLRLRGKPVRIEAIGRPGKVVHAVETEAKEMLNLLGGTPTVPAAWLIGASDGWQPRDGYETAVLVNCASLSQLAHRRACHDRVCGLNSGRGKQASRVRARIRMGSGRARVQAIRCRPVQGNSVRPPAT